MKLSVLEAFVLQDLLDRDVTVARLIEEPRLKDDAEGTVAGDFAVGVGEIALVAGFAVRCDDLDDLARIVYC